MHGDSIANMRFIARDNESIVTTDSSDAVKLWQKISNSIQEHNGSVEPVIRSLLSLRDTLTAMNYGGIFQRRKSKRDVPEDIQSAIQVIDA